MERGYWLFKSEPDVYSIDDLQRDGRTFWEGVRNFQARNFMRDEMQEGDLVLYYHSSTEVPAIVGIAKVCRGAYPDFTQFDPQSPYYDPKADPENPRWLMVDVEFVARLERPLTLQEAKEDPALEGMLVTRRGQRLSVQPVEPRHWRRVCERVGYRG